ncbi:MAG: MBL fold metallo-hydrolase [Actinomycetota bacterium]|nr:MBL fold metallo-hydrolase [Actinomycetota bacterium]
MTNNAHDVPPGSLTFVGTATTVLRLGGFTLLTDPNFLHRGQRAYLGYGLTSKRLTEPALQPDRLPPLDAVLLSHLHGDHFDRIAKRGLPKDVPVITTPQAARKLDRWGFGRCTGLRTWHEHRFERGTEQLRVTAVPAVHGPGLLDRLLPQVMGSVIELEQAGTVTLRLYVTGDTLYRQHLGEIRRRFPDIDAMVVHLGGTRIMGVMLTMDGRQGADLVRLIEPRMTVPVHTDDYTVFRSPLSDFFAEMTQREVPTEIRTVARGERMALGIAHQPSHGTGNNRAR